MRKTVGSQVHDLGILSTRAISGSTVVEDLAANAREEADASKGSPWHPPVRP